MVLLALLVSAVIHTANKSSRPPEPVEFAPSSATSSTYTIAAWVVSVSQQYSSPPSIKVG